WTEQSWRGARPMARARPRCFPNIAESLRDPRQCAIQPPHQNRVLAGTPRQRLRETAPASRPCLRPRAPTMPPFPAFARDRTPLELPGQPLPGMASRLHCAALPDIACFALLTALANLPAIVSSLREAK